MPGDIKENIKAIIDALNATGDKLKELPGAKQFSDIAHGLSQFSKIDWNIFGKGAAEGLKNFADSIKADPFKNILTSFKGLGASGKDIQALGVLGSSLNRFANIDWNAISFGFNQLSRIDKIIKSAVPSLKAFTKAVKDLDEHSDNFNAFNVLSESLKTFGEIGWAQVTFGFNQLSHIDKTIKSAIPGLKAFTKAVKDLDEHSSNFNAFNVLSESLKTFADIDWNNVSFGFNELSHIGQTIKSAIPGLKAFTKAVKDLNQNSNNFNAFNLLSESLKTFSDINWARVTLGFTMMSVLPWLIKKSAKGFDEAGKALNGLQSYAKGFEAFNTLSMAFKSFGEISWGAVTLGLVVLRIISPLFTGFGKAVQSLGNAIGTKTAQNTIESFHKFVSALVEFGNVKWGSIIFGVAMMKIFGGAFKTMSELAGPLDKGVQVLQRAASGAGRAIGQFVTAIGQAAANPLFWVGIAGLAALGLTLMTFGKAAEWAGKGVMYLAKGFKMMVESAVEGVSQLIKLADESDGLFKAAAGIAAISAALVAFSYASVASGIGGAIGGLIGKVTGTSPIDQILKLAEAGDKLEKTANALERINAAIRDMPSKSGTELSVANEEAASLSSQRGVATVTAGGKNISAPVSNKVSTTVVNNHWMPDRSMALILAPAI